MSRYINLDTSQQWTGSNTACALLLPLTLLCNKNNEINKKEFTTMLGEWIKDARTWDKYWTELKEANILVKINKDIWMVSPHHCYSEGVNNQKLIDKWDEVCYAVK